MTQKCISKKRKKYLHTAVLQIQKKKNLVPMVVVPCGEAVPCFRQAEVHLALLARNVCFLLDLAVVIAHFAVSLFWHLLRVVLQLFWYRVNWNVFIVEPKQVLDGLQNWHPRIFVGVVPDGPYYLRGEEEKEIPGSCELPCAAP